LVTLGGIFIESSPSYIWYEGIKPPFFLAALILASLIFLDYQRCLALGLLWGFINSLFSSCKIYFWAFLLYPIIAGGIVWIRKRLRNEFKVILIGSIFISLAVNFIINFLHFIFCYQLKVALSHILYWVVESVLLLILVELGLFLYYLLFRRI
jgi:hypothetical protein